MASLNGQLTGLTQDVRYALRVLRRQPGYALVALLTLTLGIGASTALFSVAYGVLLRPLAWPDADRLVRVRETRGGKAPIARPWVTNTTYRHWAEQSSTIDGLAGWRGDTLTLTGSGAEPRRVTIASVTPSLFGMLQAKPVIGALFEEKDAVPGAAPVAAIAYGLWQERFGGSPDVLGRVVQLDGESHTIVAVLPRDFAFPDNVTRVWTPFYVPPASDPSDAKQGSLTIFNAMARLKPGVTAAQAAAEGTAVSRRAPDTRLVIAAIFGSTGEPEVSVTPFIEAMTRDVRPALLVLLVAVGLLLATAAANVASLQLARATTRRREMAIRAALGAGGGRLTRQLLVENLLIGAASGALGLLLAFALHRVLPVLLPSDFPRIDDLVVDAPVIAFALLVALVAGLVFGLMPAIQARRVNLVATLADNGQAPVGGGTRSNTARARLLIMGGQVAIACILLVGAALLVRSFGALMNADRGYDPANLLTARIPLPDASYTGVRRATMVDDLLARMKATPGVRHAAVSSIVPLQNMDMVMAFPMPSHRDASKANVTVQTRARIVSPDYFAAMGMRLHDGRFLTEQDTRASMPVVVVNRAFADAYLGPRPVGETIPAGFNVKDPRNQNPNEPREEWQVAGVLENIVNGQMGDKAQPEIFVTYHQIDEGFRAAEPFIVVRTTGDPRPLIPALQSYVRQLDANVALDSVTTMHDQLTASLARPRLYAVLLGAFAGFALLIAGVGLFGVLSYSVAQRTREIGIRTALGAQPRDIVRLVVRQGLLMTLGGVTAGLFAAALLVRFLTTLVYGVTTRDPLSFVLVPLAVLLVSAAACYLPARRAARVDPLRALRS